MTPRPLPRLARDERGVTAVVTGLMLVVGLGFVGLGVDMAGAYAARRNAQNAADSAAFTGAVAVMKGASATTTAEQARAVAADYGLRNGVAGVVVTVSQPTDFVPPRETRAAQGAVVVDVSLPSRRYLSNVLGLGAATIRARAAAIRGSAGDGCVLALNPDAAQSFLFNGNIDATFAGCSMYANSNNNRALFLNGVNTIRAKSIDLVGGWMSNGTSSLPTPRTSAPPTQDPYAEVPPPDAPCSHTGPLAPQGKFPPTASSEPYVICNGDLQITTGSVEFQPGLYVLRGGSLVVNGSPSISGSGVTFAFTGATPTTVGNLRVNGSPTLKLSPPKSGTYAGIVFYQHRNASASGVNTINGSAGSDIRGAFYFPARQLNVNGTPFVHSDGCTQFIADRFQFNGTSSIGLNCEGVGVRRFGGTVIRLVQ
jgi:hypothetical protein